MVRVIAAREDVVRAPRDLATRGMRREWLEARQYRF